MFRTVTLKAIFIECFSLSCGFNVKYLSTSFLRKDKNRRNSFYDRDIKMS